MTRVRVTAFRVCFLAMTVVVAVLAMPLLLGPARWSVGVQRVWGRGVLLLLRALVGVTHEFRGRDRLPDGPCLIAAKHQSAWDTIVFLVELPAPVFIFKKELLRIPIYGWFCLRSGMIPIDRNGGGRALRRMINRVRSRLAAHRPVIIFPEGTRVKPGEHRGYQPGVAGLYRQLDVPVVPVALNSGLVWPKAGLCRTDFRIVAEYLDPIPPGLPRKEFMARLEQAIETATGRLLEEGRRQLARS
ncbi:MAG: 1-acyl-sn-glycerol-3-phosphate acyltransferase [Alphaproteobacteria bacterium]|nr:MAG: 1-acyl-sn-glycerol-3-phosphate acyltransferase [Alphaproteobacteria bacterium]